MRGKKTLERANHFCLDESLVLYPSITASLWDGHEPVVDACEETSFLVQVRTLLYLVESCININIKFPQGSR